MRVGPPLALEVLVKVTFCPTQTVRGVAVKLATGLCAKIFPAQSKKNSRKKRSNWVMVAIT